MDSALPYNDYGTAMRHRLGGRVQKLAIDARLGCPNRDGTLATGGCTFCLNEAFSPSYSRIYEGITQQIDHAIAFHLSRGRKADRYLAYFQSGSNTHAPVEQLERLYHEALSHPAIGGIVVGTRPDTISSEKLDLLEHISHSHYVAVEYGIESTSDATLRHVNRHHTFATAREAVRLTAQRQIDIGAHFIIGLPNEDEEHIIGSITDINSLGLNTIKFHQLQLYRGTPMAEEYHQHPERFMLRDYTPERYIDLLIAILRQLDCSIAVERLFTMAPRHLILHSPLGGIKPDLLHQMLISRMATVAAYQGDRLTLGK